MKSKKQRRLDKTINLSRKPKQPQVAVSQNTTQPAREKLSDWEHAS